MKKKSLDFSRLKYILDGGPERIRTIDQAVAVPCLTTWLQGHKSAYLLYQITNVMSRKILFEIQPLNHYIFSF